MSCRHFLEKMERRISVHTTVPKEMDRGEVECQDRRRLLKDSQVHRNEWPVGLIVKTLPSSDKRVRKVEVKIVKDGTAKVFLRPVSEVVVLLSECTCA